MSEWYNKKSLDQWDDVAQQDDYPFTWSFYSDDDYAGFNDDHPQASGLEVNGSYSTMSSPSTLNPNVSLSISQTHDGQREINVIELTHKQTERLAKHLTDWLDQQIELEDDTRVPMPLAEEIAGHVGVQPSVDPSTPGLVVQGDEDSEVEIAVRGHSVVIDQYVAEHIGAHVTEAAKR